MILSVDIGYKNLAWVLFNEENGQIMKADVSEIVKTKSKRKPTIDKIIDDFVTFLKNELMSHLMSQPNTKDITVLCEKQVGKARINTTMSMVLYTYFHTQTMLKLKHFEFIHSNKKFSLPWVFIPQDKYDNKESITNNSYSVRKNASVNILKKYFTCKDSDYIQLLNKYNISTNSTYVQSIMNKLKKKDDLGDATVQLFYFLSK